MQDPRLISIKDYTYMLPEDRIARFPLPVRDQSRLLYYHSGEIEDKQFTELPALLRSDDLLILNDTRVIPARLLFKKSSGGQIEIFCLEPENYAYQDAMSASGSVVWRCLVGGAKKWKNGEILQPASEIPGLNLHAEMVSRHETHFLIRFFWEPAHLVFSEIINLAGQLPLPPYFNRKAEESDYERYQTIIALNEGSVAAPTAALHFTDAVFQDLTTRNIRRMHLTLHVGAGTFKPVSAQDMSGHDMHAEAFSVPLEVIRFIRDHPSRRVIPVGTTCMRTLESLYWLGVKIAEGQLPGDSIPVLNQWEAYDLNTTLSRSEAFDVLIHHAESKGQKSFDALTSIMIAPGYKLRVCEGIVTNFHMPETTLILLVAALIGDNWRKVYQHALDHDYRFLSYGDSSLLIP